jgi:hypothetical protein
MNHQCISAWDLSCRYVQQGYIRIAENPMNHDIQHP